MQQQKNITFSFIQLQENWAFHYEKNLAHNTNARIESQSETQFINLYGN